MRYEGYGAIAGGGLAGQGRGVPTTPRPIREAPERHAVRSPFPPLPEAEREVLLTRRSRIPGSSLSPTDQARVAKLRAAGKTYLEVSEETGFTVGQIRGALRARGLTNNKKGNARQVSEMRRVEIRATYLAGGSTMKELARRHSISEATVRKIVREGDR